MTYPAPILARTRLEWDGGDCLGRLQSVFVLFFDGGTGIRHRSVAWLFVLAATCRSLVGYEKMVLFVLFDGVVVADVVALSKQAPIAETIFAELTPLAPLLAGGLFLATLMHPRLGWRAAKT
jgi:hypothetical protein